jgi:NAD(P)-dependent dehydrogenase (short-subunit alcohol dehydrogenase family)
VRRQTSQPARDEPLAMEAEPLVACKACQCRLRNQRPLGLEGFLYVTQLAIKHMLAQKTGGSIVTITAALARNPIRDRITSKEELWQPQVSLELNRPT